MSEILQIIGAIMVLGGFTLLQLHILGQQSYTYLFLNIFGSGILAVLAALGQQWGFLFLEGGWALITLWGLIARIRGRAPSSAH